MDQLRDGFPDREGMLEAMSGARRHHEDLVHVWVIVDDEPVVWRVGVEARGVVEDVRLDPDQGRCRTYRASDGASSGVAGRPAACAHCSFPTPAHALRAGMLPLRRLRV